MESLIHPDAIQRPTPHKEHRLQACNQTNTANIVFLVRLTGKLWLIFVQRTARLGFVFETLLN